MLCHGANIQFVFCFENTVFNLFYWIENIYTFRVGNKMIKWFGSMLGEGGVKELIYCTMECGLLEGSLEEDN